jgi:hypothetical protein
MSFNGSGTFIIETVGNPVVLDTEISPLVHNDTMAEIASGLSQVICRDGQSIITQNIPFNNKRLTNLSAGVSATDAANLQNIMANTGKYVSTVGGTVDAITLTPFPAITGYAAGQEFLFIAAGANTGAVTVNVSGLGVKSLTKNGATSLSASDITSSAIVRIVYDGTRFQKV